MKEMKLMSVICKILVVSTWFLSTPSSAAKSAEAAWNMERVGAVVNDNGEVDARTYSKLGPWPNPDQGRFIYAPCYDTGVIPLNPNIADEPGIDRCFAIVDLGKDPANPIRLSTVHTYDLEKSPSPPLGHIIWSDDYPYPNLPTKSPCKVDWDDPAIASGEKPASCWDPGWNTHSHYVQNGEGDILAVNQEEYRKGTKRQANYHGIKVYDISDRSNPKFLSYWEAPVSPPDPETGKYQADSKGVHHFNFQGRYLFLGTTHEGYIGKILIILDLNDPRTPKEAGRWWLPGQKTPEEDARRNWVQQRIFVFPVVMNEAGKWTKHVGMHYVSIDGDIAYLSYHQAGLVILDVSDKSNPKFLSQLDYLLPGADPTTPDADECRRAAGGKPAACGNAHSAKVVPDREHLLVMSDEYFTCPYGHVRIFDVSDKTNPRILSHFMTDQNTACGSENTQGPADTSRYVPFYPPRVYIGPSSHIGNAWGENLYFMAWYGAGVRAIDISDPYNPVETGYYEYRIDKDFGFDDPKLGASHAYDVLIGKDGLLYVSDAEAGLRVLRYTGPGSPGDLPAVSENMVPDDGTKSKTGIVAVPIDREISGLDYIKGLMEDLPTWVKWWMHFQHLIFLLGFVFAIWHVAARWYALGIVLSHAIAFCEMAYLPLEYLSLELISLNHLVWTPVLIYMIVKYKTINYKTSYGLWYALAIFQMSFSLVFDYRDASVYLMNLLG